MCLNPLTIKNPRRDFNQYIDPLYLQVPCGHCYQCQRSKLIDLETRAVCEYESCVNKGGRVYNYTLTYNEENVPWYCGIRVLCRRDFQLFKKRLKKFLGDVGSSLRIAYFGELGNKNTRRSHFHILIFSDIPFDADIMDKMVKHSWNKGFIGYPNKMVNGQIVKGRVHYENGIYIDNVDNAVVVGVNAIKYCIKYCAKSLDITSYLRKSFLDWLSLRGVFEQGEIDDFVFPDDERFCFSKKNPMTLDSLVKYFSSCYRVPNNFGASQIDKLDDNYNYVTKIPYKGNYRVYHISRYCKSLLFNITCVDNINNVKTIHKTKRWVDYNSKTLHIFAQNFENTFLSNRYLKINYTDLPYVNFESALKSLYDDCNVSLSDYFIYRTLYVTTPLQALPMDVVLRLRQSRDVSYIDLSDYDSLLSLVPIWLTNYADTLKYLNQEIYYNKYLIQWQKDVDYQNIKSAIYGTMPNYPIKLTFNQFVNSHD